MHPAIQVRDLQRDFRLYRKEEGLLAALRSVISRRWETVHAVKGINFSIQPGEFVGFLGPNGAGKTTTLKMLSGILSPTKGNCRVLGHEPFKRERAFCRAISLVMGQKTQLIWDLPPIDTFALHRDLYRVPHKEWKQKVDTLVELLNVRHILQTPVRQLSLGERMKCEIIVSLIHAPKVLFLDEPTIGLDVISQRHLWDFLRDYQRKEETTIILTSHNMQDIAHLCSRVLVVNLGKLVYDGTLDQLVELTQPKKEVSLQLHRPLSEEEKFMLDVMTRESGWTQPEKFCVRAQIPRENFSSVVREMLHKLPVDDLSVQEVDFSLVMKESFLMTPEEVPVRRMKSGFKKRLGEITRERD